MTAIAQTTGSVRGTLHTPDGEPVIGATVTVTDTRSGTSRVVRSNDNGVFTARDLIVGGPYTLDIVADNYRGTSVTDVYTKTTGVSAFDIVLDNASDSGMLEEVIVVGSASVAVADLAIGPSSNFSFEEISAMPTITRNVRDIIRLDPRVNIGRAAGGNGFGISCLGGSVKSNSHTIDGVRAADGFGLNASGNSARASFAIPYDAMRTASVEFSPIDVQYGQFTGCLVNVITKSGGNEFFGSAFYLYNDDDLTGDSINGNKVITEPFKDTDWGFEVGGPIIKDKLFFYGAYEKTDEGATQNNGCIGCDFANEDYLTESDVNRIANILSSSYGRDPGNIVRTLPKNSKRIFARLDWNINDNHRLEASYTKLEEIAWDEDDYGFDGFTLSDNFELQGTDQKSYSVRLFSNWTDRFSTEVRASQVEVQDIQGPVGGGEAQDDNIPRITVFEDGDAILTSGPGTFRSANDLQYTLEQYKFAGTYEVNDHVITGGYELDRLDVFNLFVVNGTGTFEFDSIDDLEAGIASDIDANGSYTGDINDAAASFKRDVNTVYLQDNWTVNDRLVVTAGLRYDWYTSSDYPVENPIWSQRYGFTNTTAFDGLDILQPRIGLTYDLPWDKLGSLQLRAGFGIFSGGDPTVHFANSFQNFGGAIGRGRSGRGGCTDADLDVLSSGSFQGIPPCITAQQIAEATQNLGRATAVDPDFKLPSQQRWNIGFNLFTESQSSFLDAWDINFDVIYSKAKNAANWLDLTLTQRVDEDGNLVWLPDGRPQFFAVDPLRSGCNATFIGPGEGFANVTADCNAGGDDQDILMTNGPSGSTTSISLQGAKSWDIGTKSSFDLRLGYAYTDAKVGNPVNSSTDTSSFEEVAVSVINDVKIGPAVWSNKHNLVAGLTFKHFFWDEAATTIGIFIRSRSGSPFSYTYDNNTPTGVFGDSDNEERNLFYVPTGPNDPLVDFSVLDAQGTTQAFFEWMDRKGLSKEAGKISSKNGYEEPWNTDMDIRMSQEIPLPKYNHRLVFFFDIENFLNLFSDGSNLQKYYSMGDVQEGLPVLDAALSDDGSQYIYSNFNPGGSSSSPPNYNPTFYDVDDSVWRIQLGLRYEFN